MCMIVPSSSSYSSWSSSPSSFDFLKFHSVVFLKSCSDVIREKKSFFLVSFHLYLCLLMRPNNFITFRFVGQMKMMFRYKAANFLFVTQKSWKTEINFQKKKKNEKRRKQNNFFLFQHQQHTDTLRAESKLNGFEQVFFFIFLLFVHSHSHSHSHDEEALNTIFYGDFFIFPFRWSLLFLKFLSGSQTQCNFIITSFCIFFDEKNRILQRYDSYLNEKSNKNKSAWAFTIRKTKWNGISPAIKFYFIHDCYLSIFFFSFSLSSSLQQQCAFWGFIQVLKLIASFAKSSMKCSNVSTNNEKLFR